MAKEYARSFYKSKAWKECRAAYIASVYGLCERCSRPGKIVHHKKYITPDNISDPNITLSFSNLELLCATCHQHEHYVKHEPIPFGYEFDDKGYIVKKGNSHVLS